MKTIDEQKQAARPATEEQMAALRLQEPNKDHLNHDDPTPTYETSSAVKHQ